MIINKLLVCSLLSSLALIGCVAEPEGGPEAEAADAEEVGEAQAAIEPDDDDGGIVTRTVNLSCKIGYASMFNPRAEITNNSPYAVPSYADILYTVTHAYGSPGPRSGATVGPLAKGMTKYVALTYSGSLNAYSCTAKATWELP